MANEEAGRLSVRVVPDLSGFTEKLAAGVKKAAQKAEKAAQVDVKVDLTGVDKVKSDMRKLMTELNAMAKDVKIDVKMNADKDALSKSVRQAAAAASDDAEVDVEARLDTAARARLRAEIAKLTKAISAQVDIGVDGDAFRREADLVIREAEKQLVVPITVDGLDGAAARASMNKLVDDLANLGEQIGVVDEKIAKEQLRIAKEAERERVRVAKAAAAERVAVEKAAAAAQKAAERDAAKAERAAAAEALAAEKAAARVKADAAKAAKAADAAAAKAAREAAAEQRAAAAAAAKAARAQEKASAAAEKASARAAKEEAAAAAAAKKVFAEQQAAAKKVWSAQAKARNDYYKGLSELRGADAKNAKQSLLAQYRANEASIERTMRIERAAISKLAQFRKDKEVHLSFGDSDAAASVDAEVAKLKKGYSEVFAVRKRLIAENQDLWRGVQTIQSRTLTSTKTNAGKITKEWGKLGDSVGKLSSKFNVLEWEAKNLHRAFGNLAPALLGLGITFQAVLPAALSLAGGVEDLAKAAVLVPAALGSAVAVIATVTVGLNGLGDAFSAVAEGDADDLADAMKKLSKNGKAVVKSFQALYPQLTKVKKSVQDQLLAGVDDDLTRLGSKLLPVAAKGMRQLAAAMNGVVRNAAAYATSQEALAGTRKLFKSTTKATKILAKGTEDVLSGVTAIGVAGAKYLPKIAKYVVGVAGSFNDWAHELVADGTFDRWVKDTAAGWLSLVDGAVSLVEIVQGLIRAARAAGALSLGGLADGLERISAAVNSRGAQDALTAFWSGMERFAQASGRLAAALTPLVGPLLTGLGTVIGKVADAIDVAVPAVEQFVAAMGPDFRSGLQAIADALTLVVGEAAKSPAVFAAVAAGAVAISNPMVGAAAAVVLLVAAIGRVRALAASGAFDPLIAQLQPIATAAQSAQFSLNALMVTLLSLSAQAATSLQSWMPQLSGTFTGLATSVVNLVDGFAAMLNGVIEVGNALGLWEYLGTTIVEIFDGAARTVTGAIELIAGQLKFFGSLLSGDFSAAFDSIPVTAQGALDLLAGIVEIALSALPGKASKWLTDFVDKFRTMTAGPAMKAAMGKVKKAVVDAGPAIRAAVTVLITMIVSKFTGMDLGGAGKDAIQGFIDGMKSMASSAKDAAASVAQGALNGVAGALDSHSPSKKMRKLGEYAGQGFYLGIQDTAEKVISVTKSLISKVLDAVDSKGLSKSTGKELVAYIKAQTKGLKEAARERDKVANQLSNAQDKLKDVLSDYKNLKSSTKTSIISDFGVSNSDATTVSSYVSYLKDAVTEQKKYNKLIAKLDKLGLNSTGLQQLITEGADDGMALAESLAAGGKAAVTQVNKLQAQLNSAATAMGTSAAEDMYGAGVDAAQGIVDGLKSKQKALNNAAKSMAKAMVKAIKKSLGIRSPSKVTRREVGRPMGEGTALGIEDKVKRVRQASARVRAAATAGTGVLSGQSGSSVATGPTVQIGTMVSSNPEVTAAKIAARVRAANARYNLSGVR